MASFVSYFINYHKYDEFELLYFSFMHAACCVIQLHTLCLDSIENCKGVTLRRRWILADRLNGKQVMKDSLLVGVLYLFWREHIAL